MIACSSLVAPLRAPKQSIKAPTDQTLLLRIPPDTSSQGAEVDASATALLQFIEQAAEILTESLNAGPLEAAIVQGSGFCGAMAWEGGWCGASSAITALPGGDHSLHDPAFA